MIDKQQLQAMGEHQAEQHMCMAKQIEDLQARLQECANGEAKMQEQRDYAYKMMGKFGGERNELARQLKAANQQIAAMAELLLVASNELCKEAPLSVAVRELIGKNIRGVAPFPPEKTESDYEQTEQFDGPDPYSIGHMDGWNDFRRAALAGELPDYVAGADKMVSAGWLLSKLPQADDEEKSGGWKLSVDFLSCVRSKTFEQGWGVGEEEIETVLTIVDSMLAAAPKQEPTK